VLLVRDPVDRYESARKMYLCFKKEVQERGEQFHEEHNMAAYLAAAAGGKKASFMPLQRGLYMVSEAEQKQVNCLFSSLLLLLGSISDPFHPLLTCTSPGEPPTLALAFPKRANTAAGQP